MFEIYKKLPGEIMTEQTIDATNISQPALTEVKAAEPAISDALADTGKEEQQAPADTDSTKQPRVFSQEEVDEISTKIKAKERSKAERLLQQMQSKLQELGGYQANFDEGALLPHQTQVQQQPTFDPNAPLTMGQLLAIAEQQKQQEEATRYNQMAKETIDKYDDFHQVREQNHEFFMAAQHDPGILSIAESTGQPFEFMYQIAKTYPNELKNVLSQQSPFLRAAALDKLHDKLKARSAVPNVSSAPAPIRGENGDAINLAGIGRHK
jgi:hypothetical protein